MCIKLLNIDTFFISYPTKTENINAVYIKLFYKTTGNKRYQDVHIS